MKNLPSNYPGLDQNGSLCSACPRWLVIAGGERTGESHRARPSEAAGAAHAPPAGPGWTVHSARLTVPGRLPASFHFHANAGDLLTSSRGSLGMPAAAWTLKSDGLGLVSVPPLAAWVSAPFFLKAG